MLIELKNDLRIRCCFVIHLFQASVGLLISFHIRGKLHSVDQYLNFKLTGLLVFNFYNRMCLWLSHRNPRRKWREIPSLTVCDIYIYPWLCCQVYVSVVLASRRIFMMTTCRYVHLSKDDVDIDILQATFPTFMRAPYCQGFWFSLHLAGFNA